MSPGDRVLAALDKLHRVVDYLANSWGVDTPPEYMQANVDARGILIELEIELEEEALRYFSLDNP